MVDFKYNVKQVKFYDVINYKESKTLIKSKIDYFV